MKYTILIGLLLLIPIAAAIPAFPDAVGPGAKALEDIRSQVKAGTADMQIIRVTESVGNGPGTFVDAITKTDPNKYTIIIFDIVGKFNIEGEFRVPNNFANVYVAGQTSPGGVVHIGGRLRSLDHDNNDVVIRYIRARTYAGNNWGARGCQRVIFDHYSGSHSAKGGGQYLISATGTFMSYDPTKGESDRGLCEDVTLMNIMATMPDSQHPTICAFGGDPKSRQIDLMKNALLYNSFLMGPGYRTCNVGGDKVAQVNTLAYNTADRWTAMSAEFDAQFIEYRAEFGPTGATTGRSWSPIIVGAPTLGRCPEPNGDCKIDERKLYAHNIRFKTNDYQAVPDDALWRRGPNGEKPMVACRSLKTDYCNDGDPIIDILDEMLLEKVNSMWTWPGVPFPEIYALNDAGVDRLLSDVGANAVLDCKGNWVEARDDWDKARVKDYYDKTGMIGYTDIDVLPRSELDISRKFATCIDSDNDGMPDEFEDRYNLNKNNRADNRLDSDGDGYLNVEEYLNGGNPKSADEVPPIVNPPPVEPPQTPGFDLNSDGTVNIFDLIMVAKGIGSGNLNADANGDGIVNIFDLIMVIKNFS